MELRRNELPQINVGEIKMLNELTGMNNQESN